MTLDESASKMASDLIESHRLRPLKELTDFAQQAIEKDRESRWISVNTCIPNDNQKVWFWTKQWGLQHGTFLLRDQWLRDNMFVNSSGGYIYMQDVTHYQKFIEPQAPKL